ncbi:MAG: pyrrolysine--tRNA(Pyl) ligase small subunit [Bacillota bacterium]|nr:pyrrolysine--tRNA(Pyl) ligase small subunit [Bacillota bacterium]MDP4160261.1 pyrrolysine--tRNA(Pyl) ligase small subunit [Bacillota bacterium]
MMANSEKAKRYFRKRVDLFPLLSKMKLWPSRAGTLHGIRTIVEKGNYAEVTTHCNHVIILRNSKNGRVARWLRNKWYFKVCPVCRIPDWKLEKFSRSVFSQHFGTDLRNG